MGLSGSYVYLVNSTAGLVVVDVSDPTSPDSVGSCLTERNIQEVSVSSSHAYVTEPYTQGLIVVDISTPTDPVQAGSYASPISVEDLFVSGDYAYLGTMCGLWVVDVSDSTNPVLTGRFNPHPESQFVVHGLDVSDNLAYLGTGKLYIVDVSDPTAPAAVGSLAVFGSISAVDVSSTHAYLACSGEGLKIIDISTPSAPVEVGSYDTPGNAYDVQYVAPYVYVADDGAGLRIIDVTDPTTPEETGSFNTPGSARAVYYYDSHVYVADYEQGMPIIDVSDPTAPVEVSTYSTIYDLFDVFVSNGKAYLANWYGGIRVLDVSDLSDVTEIGYYSRMGSIMCFTVQVVDGLIYTGNSSDGFSIFRYQVIQSGIEDTAARPQKFSLSQNYPNPFNPETTIRFALPEDRMVNLRIYNIAGQTVRTLKRERMTAGYHQVRWDGRDFSGREVGSGVYFYRIQAGEFRETKRMVLLK
jgi:hypothetical protein